MSVATLGRLITAVTATPSPTPSQNASVPGASSSTDWWLSLFSAAVVAAVVTAFVNMWLARLRRLEEERSRVRATLAEAFQTYAEYKEFPYAIRRRNQEEPGKERVRLSESLRAVQARISYYESWTAAESVAVGDAYEALIKDARRIAGGAMREAWLAPPITSDEQMNMPPETVDLSALRPVEDAYVKVAHTHVARLGRLRRST